MRKIHLTAFAATASLGALAATYNNPVLHMDFSDPDVCQGHDRRFYMTASSFGGLPGLPILASKDLVNWSYVGYALKEHPFQSEWCGKGPEHGNAVWAPSIRYRSRMVTTPIENGFSFEEKHEYIIYWGDPDRGAYRVSAPSPEGPWSEPRLVVEAKGLIDTCPLYDDDGRVYLVNGWAQSRAGMNSVLTVRELDADETHAISEPVMVYDGVPEKNFTTEGPKFYKKDGEYWLFFPAGGVEQGWQVAARAKSPFGPYETKTVLAQGKTDINGPHQGGWVRQGDKDWFVHFRDKGPYGRIVYLEPMTWPEGEWPVMGNNGEPVASGEVPGSAPQKSFGGLAVSDEFNSVAPGLQWQFLGKSDDLKAWCTPYGFFRLYSTPYVLGGKSYSSLPLSGTARNLWETPNLMVQKFPSESFTAVLKAQVGAKVDGEEAGLIVQGRSYARIGLRFREKAKAFDVVYVECRDADKGKSEDKPVVLGTVPANVIAAGIRSANVADIYFKLSVVAGQDKKGNIAPKCTFAWSADGEKWNERQDAFLAREGKWIGATFGLYAVCEPDTKDRGWIDADYLRVSEEGVK